MITKKQIKTITDFMGFKPAYQLDWNYLMYDVIPHIESITGTCMKVDRTVSISFWYSTKKKNVNSEKRKPFDLIGGKHHNIVCYYKEIQFKAKKQEKENSKLEATINCCYRFIVWYNKTVLKKKK